MEAVAAVPTLEVRRTIRAPRQRVFDAWTKAEEVKKWHAPGPMHASLVEIDLRPGGRYHIVMVEPDGREHSVSGAYREIDPPRKVVYTWSHDGDNIVKNSLITIEFLERGDSTEVVLTHAIADAKERASHTQGWTSILEKLQAAYTGK